MRVADVHGWKPRFRISYGALLLILVAILIARLVGLHISQRQPGARD